MKYILLYILLLFSSVIISQTPRSEYINNTCHITVKGNSLVRVDSIALQINNRTGTEYDAEVFIPYSKGDKVSIGDAWIEDMSGNIIRKLKKNEIYDRSYISNASLYEDDFIKHFNLNHNTYPYRIKYSYKITYSKFIDLINLNYTHFRTPVKSQTIILEVPEKLPLKHKQENVEEPTVEENNGIIRYKWKFSYIPRVIQENNSSPNSTNAPIIKVIPSQFKYGIDGSLESWEAVGNWIYRLNKNRDKLTLAEENKINELLSGINVNKEKAKILYHYLQNYTRYINVSINIGGLQTYPASYVCDNKYGDCKALTNYMQAMLKYAGIESYYTLIEAGDDIIDIDSEFPTPSAFNHVILTIPFENDTTFLECTSKTSPFGYLGTFTQGRKGLIVDENNSRFVNTPKLTPNDVLCTRNFTVNINTSEAKLDATERGEKYEYSLYMITENDNNTLNKFIRNTILTGSYDLLDFKFEEKNRDSAKINLKAQCKIHNLYKKYGKNLIIEPFPIEIESYDPPGKRSTDVQINYPEYYKDTIKYEFSDQKITKMPENISINSDYGHYSLKYEISDNKLFVYKKILINAGRYTLNEYPEFYKFITQVKNNEINKIYMEVE